MSVVIRRDHPSGDYGISVAAFPEDGNVVIGLGALREMCYLAMSQQEASEVATAIEEAIIDVGVGPSAYIATSTNV